MDKPRSSTGGYILAAVLGATAGGIAVAIVTKAIPKCPNYGQQTCQGGLCEFEIMR